MNNFTIPTSFITPITSEAIKVATIYKDKFENTENDRQIYLNIIAVYAVAFYCKCMSIKTDLANSDSFNTIAQCLSDTADLNIDEFGKVECRPFLPGETTCMIPGLNWSDRLGYFAVEIDEENREATIVGFLANIPVQQDSEDIPLTEFDIPDAFLDAIEELEKGVSFLESNDEVAIAFRDKLSDLSIPEIVVQLDKIYRTEDESGLRYAGGDFLYECVTEKQVVSLGDKEVSLVREESREESDFDEQEEYQDLAENLFDKLADVWGKNTSAPLVTKTSIFDLFGETLKRSQQQAVATINELADFANWFLVNPLQPSLEGYRDIGGDVDRSQPEIRNIPREILESNALKLPLTIAGGNYELRIKATNIDLNEWNFELINTAPGGKIPPGFKLSLLDESQESIEGAEDVSINGDPLFITSELNSGEAIAIDIEPMPDNYHREIFSF